MNEWHFPWLELSISILLLGALWISHVQEARRAYLGALVSFLVVFLLNGSLWIDFACMGAAPAHGFFPHLLPIPQNWFAIDRLNAPLLTLTSLLYLVALLTTLRSRVNRFTLTWMLVSQSIQLLTLSSVQPWALIAFLVAGTLPPYVELRMRQKATQVFVAHMYLFAVLLIAGQALADVTVILPWLMPWAVMALAAAVFIRSGVFPFHGWMSDLFEQASYGTSLLFTLPLPGAYAILRLLVPIASESMLDAVRLVALATAVCGAGLALVQIDLRRFICYLLLSHCSLVLTGLVSMNLISVTGALCAWISTSLALGGLGFTLRALECRCGRVSMRDFQGLYEHTPSLATFFLLTCLASIGFPGTLGFIGIELMIDGAVNDSLSLGFAVSFASMLNAIAVVRAFFLIFTGRQFPATVSLKIRPRERYAVLILSLLILLGGIFPQSNIAARYEAARELIDRRVNNLRSLSEARGQLHVQQEEPLAAPTDLRINQPRNPGSGRR